MSVVVVYYYIGTRTHNRIDREEKKKKKTSPRLSLFARRGTGRLSIVIRVFLLYNKEIKSTKKWIGVPARDGPGCRAVPTVARGRQTLRCPSLYCCYICII